MNAAPEAHRPDIDGLRGLAVLLVVLFHAWPKLLPGGYVGVDVFFVISGFVVTRLVQRQRAAGTFGVVDFFSRRVNRLAPALLLVIGATLGFAALRFSPTLLALTASHAAAALGLSANLLVATQGGYFDAAAEVKPLLHLWSLSVEEQFYLLVPLAVLVARLGPRWTRPLVILVTGASLSSCIVLTQLSARWAYFMPMTRAWELLAGVLLALFGSPGASRGRTKELTSVAGIGLIVGAALAFDGSTSFPGALALVPVGGTVLVIAAGNDAVVNRWLSKPLLVGVGLVSYPLYLWHWPVLTIGHLSVPASSHAVMTPLLVVTSLVLAWLTARFVERPARTRQSRRIALTLALGGGLTAAVLVGMVLTFTPEQWAFRDPRAARVARFEHEYDFKTDARWGTCWLLDDEQGPSAEECIERSPANQPLVVIWGDSYAARLTAGLRLIQAERPTFRIGQRTRASCPPLFRHGTDVCRAANAAVMEELRALEPDVLVLHARWDGVPYDLAQTLLALKQMVPATKVVVLGQPPEWPVGLPWALTKWVGDEVVPERLEPERFAEQRVFEQKTRGLATSGGASFASALDALCDANETCLVRLSLEPLMLSTWDYGHLTTPAAKVVARRLVLALELP